MKSIEQESIRIFEENRALKNKLYTTQQELYLANQLLEELKIKYKNLKKQNSKKKGEQNE